MNTLVRFILATVLSLGAFPKTAWSQCEVELLAADGGFNAKAGQSVGISGDVVLVGAYSDDDSSGSAYVWRLIDSTWIQEQKLTASDATPYDFFGESVAIDGDIAVVGAKRDDDNGWSSGSAYIFRWTGVSWVEEQKLLAWDAEEKDFFGSAVAISGATIVVGAVNEGNTGLENGHGSAYVFRFNGTTWMQEQKLLASDSAARVKFGFSASISGNVAVIGAYGDDDSGPLSGSAYVFHRTGSTWSQEQKLLASDGEMYEYFGYSVGVYGDLAVIGASKDNDTGTAVGSAYVFRFNGSVWVEKTELYGSGAAPSGGFAKSVSVGDELAVIGAPESAGGTVHVFRFKASSWVEEKKILASDAAPNDNFGHSVAVSGDKIVAGAPMKSDGSRFKLGSAYVFALACAADCTVDRDCDDAVPCTVDVCTDGVCSHDGTGCVCEECVTLDADGDGDVDLADVAAWLHCIEGPN